MKLSQKLIALIMSAVMLLALAGCVASAEPGAVAKSDIGTEALVDTPTPQVTDPARIIKSASEWNAGRTYAVAQVIDITGAEANIGSLAEGFPKEGIGSAKLTCEVLDIYNFARLKDAAEAEDASYLYFTVGDFEWIGGGSAAKKRESRQGSLRDSDITEEYLTELKNNGANVTYMIYLDWNHKDTVGIGDTILVSIDPQVSINPNSQGDAYAIEDSKVYRAVVAPFAADHLQPHIAKFVDGKLQLPAELSGAFELGRLYDDAEPQLTGIKNGDSVEDVVAFLKTVEQDMARYEAENTPEPVVESVTFDPEPVGQESPEPEPRENSEGLQSAVGGTLGWYSAAYPDMVYYADHAGGIVVIDAGSNTQNVLESSAISADEILLKDANGDCLLSMTFSLKEGSVINRMELDGSGKREIVRLPDHILTYLNKNSIYTKGSKLYIQLKNTKIQAENDVYELMEIDVDAETARKLYTFERGQAVIGGYGNSLFLRTDLGRIPDPEIEDSLIREKSMFTPVIRYRFDAFDIETGQITETMEAVVSNIWYFGGHNCLSLTLEKGDLVVHIYDCTAGTEAQTAIDVVPEFLMDEPNIGTTNWVIPGEALDGTHFTLGYCEFEKENGEFATDARGQLIAKDLHYCIVDAKNGTAISLDDVYADSAVKVPADAVVFAETDTTFYFMRTMEPSKIYAVPRQQILSGHVTDVTVIQQ